jgi:hypothetical protein
LHSVHCVRAEPAASIQSATAAGDAAPGAAASRTELETTGAEGHDDDDDERKEAVRELATPDPRSDGHVAVQVRARGGLGFAGEAEWLVGSRVCTSSHSSFRPLFCPQNVGDAVLASAILPIATTPSPITCTEAVVPVQGIATAPARSAATADASSATSADVAVALRPAVRNCRGA